MYSKTTKGKLLGVFWNLEEKEMWLVSEYEIYDLLISSTSVCHPACASCTQAFTPKYGGGCTSCKSGINPSKGEACTTTIPDPALGKIVGGLEFGGIEIVATPIKDKFDYSDLPQGSSGLIWYILLAILICIPIIGIIIHACFKKGKNKKPKNLGNSNRNERSGAKFPGPQISVNQPLPGQMNPFYLPPILPQQSQMNSSFRPMNLPPMNSGFQPIEPPVNVNYPPVQRPAMFFGPPPYRPQQNQMQVQNNAKPNQF